MVDVANIHLPVLLDDCVNLMAPALEHENAIAVDCTLGLAGHSIAFLKAAPQARLIGIDRDSEALGLAIERNAPTGLQLQRAVVVKDLGHLAQARQHLATAHHGALAVGAHRVGRLRAVELHGRAATWAGRAVVALGGHGRGCVLRVFLGSSPYVASASSY